MIISLDEQLSQKELDLANYLAQQEISDLAEYISFLQEQCNITFLFSNGLEHQFNSFYNTIMNLAHNHYFDKNGHLKPDAAKQILELYSKRMDLDELLEEENDDEM